MAMRMSLSVSDLVFCAAHIVGEYLMEVGSQRIKQ